jgi:general secretion pathway protein A
LLGEAGSGKTTIIRAALERQPSRVHYVHLHNPALTRAEFIEMLALQFGLSERAQTSKTILLFELEALLRRRQEASETTLLVVDEAQSLSPELLEELRLLANVETNDGKLVSVIIAGQPELARRLNDQRLRQLKQRIALRCELRPLTPLETLSYVAGRMRVAGCQTQVFTREAISVIHAHAKGLPRTISVIADNALLNTFALGERLVTADIALEVCREFEIAERPAASDRAPEGLTSAAVAPPVSVLEHGKERLLAIERAGAVAPMVVRPTEERSLFSALFPKRRRFSFFFSS